MFLAALGANRWAQGFGQQGRGFQRRQRSFPELLASDGRLLLQPAQVIAVLPRWRRQRLPGGVVLDDFGKQLRVAPAVHQDVMTGVDQVPGVGAGTHQFQTEQRRRAQLETLGTFGIGQRVGVGRLKHFQRQRDLTGNRLMRGVETLPVEAAAQNIVTLDRCLPGAGETLDVQAADVQAQLADVGADLRLVQGVEQHALLHWRQRIQVLQRRDGERQFIELRLIDLRQREVRRRGLRHFKCAAVIDQRVQFMRVFVGQTLDGRGVEHLAAEAPAQGQLAAIDLTFDHQPVAQRRRRVLRHTVAFGGWGEQRALIELTVELPQIVEGNPRLRQRRQFRADLRRAEVAQRAVTQAFVRDVAQLFLD
ncbi:hypothetical protein D3C86_975480 [compost metagenome]